MEQKDIKLRSNKVKLYYLHGGEGEFSLVFLHGWCINAQYWQDQLDHCTEQYSVYAIDLAGFGKSTAQREDWTIQEYALDVAEFIDALGLSKVILLGHSMSGEIMLEIALQKNPAIIGVVGVDNFKFIDVEFTAEQMEQFQAFYPLLQNDFKTHAPAYAERMLFHPLSPKLVIERVKADFASANPDISFAVFTNLMQYSSTVPEKLENLPYELYLINTDFPPTNLAGLENHCKNGFRVYSLSNAGHYPMIEKTAEFNRLLDQALSAITSRN